MERDGVRDVAATIGRQQAAAAPALQACSLLPIPSTHPLLHPLRQHRADHPPHLTAPQALHLSSITSLRFLILITVSGLPQE